MIPTFRPRTIPILSAGVLLLAAPDVLAARRAPAPAGETAAPVGDAAAPAGDAAASTPAPDATAPATPEPAPAEPAKTEPSPPAASAGAQASVGGGKPSASAKADGGKRRRREAPAGVVLDEKTGKVRDTRPWIRRYAPERHLFEIGFHFGMFIAADDHDLYHPGIRQDDRKWAVDPLWKMNAAFGARLAYFPLRVLGFEGEFTGIPALVRNPANELAFVYGLRGHAIVQLPWFRVTPFLLGGYGMLAVASPRSVLGSDIDPTGHWGGGIKIYMSRRSVFRLEARHLISAQTTKLAPEFTNHAEVTAGFSLVLGRVRPLPPPKDPDIDKDGFLNDVDQCPKLAGVAPDGCPVIDSDGDSFVDKVDQCPFEAGVAPDGCPPKDRDKDTFLDEVDKCPDEPGIAPDGCPPPPDTDKDGIVDKDDKCPMHPESYNGFDDEDGCPDKLPETAKSWDGRAIEGIFFEFGSDKIKKNSAKTLDRAVATLSEFKSIKIEVSGHTDDVGTREKNLDLSQRRADAVKRYLVEKGIDEARIRTVGYGPDKPVDPAKTAKARAKNRRIEFRVIIDKPEGAASSADADAPADASAPPAAKPPG